MFETFLNPLYMHVSVCVCVCQWYEGNFSFRLGSAEQNEHKDIQINCRIYGFRDT